MKFWLIFKQSFRSFYSKIVLYLAFTVFLVISLAMIAGLFGFSYSFDKNVKDSLGRVKLNQRYDFSRSYVPTWILETQSNVPSLDPSNHFVEQELDNKIKKFLIGEFLQEFPDRDGPYTSQNLANPQNESQLKLALVTLGIGYSWGDLNRTLQENDVFNNQLLYKYFSTLQVSSPADILQTNLKIYNDFISEHRGNFNEKYFTGNVGLAIFLEKFKSDKANYEISSGGRKTTIFSSKTYFNPDIALKYQRINPKSNLVEFEPDLLKTTPWVLFANEATPFNIFQELSVRDMAKYREFIEEGRYTYVPPAFLKKYNLHLGDKISFYNKSDSNQTDIDFIIIGTMAEYYQFNEDADPDFTIPYQWARNYELNNGLTLAQDFPPFSDSVRLHNKEFKNEVPRAQKAAAKLFLEYFDVLRPEDKARFYSQLIDPAWSLGSLQYSYDLAISLFYSLATVLSVLIIVLLFVVFYFITREIINMERSTLFYLKAMGIYNSGLSVLTTLAMLVPILIGIIGGFFGALAIQKMLSDIALSRTVLRFDFFTFNFPFVLTLILSVVIIWLGFYLINFHFLRSPSLVNPTAHKPGFLARGLIKIKTKMDPHFSRQVRIALAFAFKNIYKNIVTFCILSIAFGLILYIVQFQSSLSTIASAYEKWNLPYKSVLYQPKLEPIIADSNQYERSYDVITEDDLPKLISIDSTEQLKTVIQEYLAVVERNGNFNWSVYFLSQKFTKSVLNLVGDNPTDDQINEWIDQFYPEANYQVRGQIITIVKQVVRQNKTLRDSLGYNDGYNIFFGKVLTPRKGQTKRNILAVETNYPANNSREIKSLLFENDVSSRKHYEFGSAAKADDYIQNGTFSIAKGNEQQINIKNPLRVSISSYLQTNYSIKIGDVVPIRLHGFKTDSTFDGYRNDNSALVYAYVSHIVKGDTIENTFFTSQIGVLNYLSQGSHEVSDANNKLAIADQEQYYGDLLKQMEENQLTLSNTVFTADSDVPFGIRNITLPFYKRTNPDKPLGSRIEDFYANDGSLQKYLSSFEDNIAIFHIVTTTLHHRTEQFTSILLRFVIIFTLFALVISLILVTLVLLENRQIISVLKALGYRRVEITGYLISGYLLSTILAIIAAIGLSFLAFFLTKRPISQYLGMSVYYLFSWQFFLLAIFLGIIFVSIMSISIAIFTRYQNPKNAFVSA